jgi:predicted enzyme involved in methoxymalonyl-ACP biosynthesis
VLKREMELAMLDGIAERARAAGVTRLVGYYLPTKKNGMVAEHYAGLGFEKVRAAEDSATVWELSLEGYESRTCHIRVLELVHG